MQDILEWEEMSPEERLAVKIISERSFLGFLRSYFQLLQGERWDVNWHHRMIADRIEKIVRGECGNTIFNVPPGSGKTEMLSIHAPVWALMQVNKIRSLQISSGDTLANRNSRRMKSIIKSKEFKELWPFEFGVDQAEEWNLLDERGKPRAEVVSRPMQGQIVGSRGGYIGDQFSGWINLDDPDKPTDMFSEVRRAKNHETAVNTIRSRRGDKSREHPTPIILTQQRLHSEDLTWFFMSGGMGMSFDQMKIPALINDEYIDSLPEPYQSDCRKSVEGTERIRGYYSFWPKNEHVGDLIELWDSNQYTFMSQYMQEPESLTGGVFDADAFQFWSEDMGDGVLPRPHKFDYRFITADTAQKAKTHNDFTVFAHWGFYDGKVYLLDLVRGKFEAPALRASALSLINMAWGQNDNTRNGVLRSVYIEDKSSGTGLIQELANKTPLRVTPVPRGIDKFTRAMDVQAPQRAGCVVLQYGAAYNNEFISEVGAFTHDDTHKHDDQTDAMMDAIEQAIIKPNIGGNQMMMFGGGRRRR